MKRLLIGLLLAALAVSSLAPASDARRVVVRRAGPRRTVVVVRRGWPLRRPLRAAVIQPVRTEVRVTAATYLAPIVFTGVVVAATAMPAHDAIVWEDAESLSRGEDWTEFTLNCNTRGR